MISQQASLPDEPIAYVEYVVDWSDGRQAFYEDYLRAGRAVRYRQRMFGFHSFVITAWYSTPAEEWNVLWDLEWTAADMHLTLPDYEALYRQRVPLKLLDQLFKHPGLHPDLFREERNTPVVPA